MRITTFIILLSNAVFLLPFFMFSQRFVSLENTGKLKRIRIEEGLRIRVQENQKDYWIRAEITHITKDSIYFGPSGVAVDSIVALAIPPGRNRQYLIALLSGGIPGSFLLAIVSLVNNVTFYPHDKNKLILPLSYTGLGFGLLYVVIKLSNRKFKIGPHWELKVMEIPLFE